MKIHEAFSILDKELRNIENRKNSLPQDHPIQHGQIEGIHTYNLHFMDKHIIFTYLEIHTLLKREVMNLKENKEGGT